MLRGYCYLDGITPVGTAPNIRDILVSKSLHYCITAGIPEACEPRTRVAVLDTWFFHSLPRSDGLIHIPFSWLLQAALRSVPELSRGSSAKLQSTQPLKATRTPIPSDPSYYPTTLHASPSMKPTRNRLVPVLYFNVPGTSTCRLCLEPLMTPKYTVFLHLVPSQMIRGCYH